MPHKMTMTEKILAAHAGKVAQKLFKFLSDNDTAVRNAGADALAPGAVVPFCCS